MVKDGAFEPEHHRFETDCGNPVIGPAGHRFVSRFNASFASAVRFRL
jgi:hypothetical protein